MQMRSQASDSPSAQATSFTQVCLERLRQDLQAFSLSTHRDQYHTPRNLLLALIAEVRAPGGLQSLDKLHKCHFLGQWRCGLEHAEHREACREAAVGCTTQHFLQLSQHNTQLSLPEPVHAATWSHHLLLLQTIKRSACLWRSFSGRVRLSPACQTGQQQSVSMSGGSCQACCCTWCAWQTCAVSTWAGRPWTNWQTRRHCEYI